MENFILFPEIPPIIPVYDPVTIQVRDRSRAEMVRSELEETYKVFDDYSKRRPKAMTAILDSALFNFLALLLDDYIVPGVIADVEAFKDNYHPGKPINEEMYKEYLELCIEQGYNPYQKAASALSRFGFSAASMVLMDLYPWNGIPAFFERYPLIRKMVHTVTRNFQQSILLCCDRVLEDWSDINTLFFPGQVLSSLSKISTTGGDFHKGGRQVLLLEFIDSINNPHKLVYKPSDVERDFRMVGDYQTLNGVLANLTVVTGKGLNTALNSVGGSLSEIITADGNIPVPVYKILPCHPGSSLPLANGKVDIRKSYGYLEYLTNTQNDNRVQNPQEIKDFYLQFGALIAMSYVFQLTDMHQENLIVHQRRPHLIDLEMAYSGIMKLPDNTNLSSAYKTFDTPVQQREVIFEGGYMSYRITGEREPTKNQLFNQNGTVIPLRQGTDSMTYLIQGFRRTLTLLKTQHAHYTQWLTDAQNCVTRILPYGTGLLITQLQFLHGQKSGRDRISSPLALKARVNENGRTDIDLWGNNFFTKVHDPLTPILNPYGLNLNFHGLEPKFSVWLDSQMAADFLNGDVPAFYQKMSTRDALNSEGNIVPIPFGDAVMASTVANRVQIATDLINVWAGQNPLLPSSYFNDNVANIVQAFFTDLIANAQTFQRCEVSGGENIMGW